MFTKIFHLIIFYGRLIGSENMLYNLRGVYVYRAITAIYTATAQTD